MDLANEMGFTVDKILEEVLENVMFEEDPGVSIALFIQPMASVLELA